MHVLAVGDMPPAGCQRITLSVSTMWSLLMLMSACVYVSSMVWLLVLLCACLVMTSSLEPDLLLDFAVKWQQNSGLARQSSGSPELDSRVGAPELWELQ